MAEIHVAWSDGRTEVRSLLPGQVVTVGDAREPCLAKAIPLGGTVVFGRTKVPFCRVRLHGSEIPAMCLVTASTGRLALPSARSNR